MRIQSLLATAALIFTTQVGTPARASIVAQRHHLKTNLAKTNLAVETNKNLVLWCGAASALEQSRFPYLAAIRNYRSSKGAHYEVATVYKKGKVVFRQYVYHDVQNNQSKYETSSDEFSLKLEGHGRQAAELKAVVHDEDGVKIIAAGSIPCARPKHG